MKVIYIAFLLFIVMFSIVCATIINAIRQPSSNSRTLIYVDSAFIGQVNSFKYEAKMRNIQINLKTLSIVFGIARNKDAAGECVSYKDGHNLIIVPPNMWVKLTAAQKEQMIFHELGHCVLKRSHCKAQNYEVMPISIMFPMILDTTYYKENRDELIEELFNANERCY
jgi:hypothetical protein